VAKPGEIAQIVSQAQFDYFAKQAKAAKGQGTPLDSRGQAHRAARDETGKVTKPGGGSPDRGPTGNEAEEAILAFYQAGGKRSDLPKESPTKSAHRKDSEHAKMRNDKVVRPATRPPGSSEYERDQMRSAGTKKPVKGRYLQRHGQWYYQTPASRQAQLAARAAQQSGTKTSSGSHTPGESFEYRSKTIDEDFDKAINEVLGL
jgi:hypothetical protein